MNFIFRPRNKAADELYQGPIEAVQNGPDDQQANHLSLHDSNFHRVDVCHWKTQELHVQ